MKSQCNFFKSLKIKFLATSPVPGCAKSLTNSTFVGFTRNTGHKHCKYTDNGFAYDGFDLVRVRPCFDFNGQD